MEELKITRYSYDKLLEMLAIVDKNSREASIAAFACLQRIDKWDERHERLVNRIQELLLRFDVRPEVRKCLLDIDEYLRENGKCKG